MKLSISSSWWILICLVLWSAPRAWARPPEEAEFQAAGILGERIAEWIADLERRPASIGVFSVHSNYPLEQDYSAILETEILKSLAAQDFQHVAACPECRTPQVTVEDENLVISKGAPDLETMRKIGQKHAVETFLTVEIYRTKISLLAQAVLYENPTGKVRAVQRFKIPAVSFSDASVQVLLTVGAGKASAPTATGSASSSSSTTLSTGVNLMLLEELGFGKGGLDLGGIFGGNAGSLIYINPTFALRGRYGTSALGWALCFGVGYGFSSGAKGLTPRIGYELYLGSLTVVGVEGTFFVPDKSGTNAMQSYFGFHLGLALGR